MMRLGTEPDLCRLDLESSPHCVVLHLTNLRTWATNECRSRPDLFLG